MKQQELFRNILGNSTSGSLSGKRSPSGRRRAAPYRPRPVSMHSVSEQPVEETGIFSRDLLDSIRPWFVGFITILFLALSLITTVMAFFWLERKITGVQSETGFILGVFAAAIFFSGQAVFSNERRWPYYLFLFPDVAITFWQAFPFVRKVLMIMLEGDRPEGTITRELTRLWGMPVDMGMIVSGIAVILMLLVAVVSAVLPEFVIFGKKQ